MYYIIVINQRHTQVVLMFVVSTYNWFQTLNRIDWIYQNK